MLAQPLRDMVANLTGYTTWYNWTSHSYYQVVPIEPGGVTIVSHNSAIVSKFAFGKRNVYASVNGLNVTYLPVDEQEDATIDTIYDMASLTKIFTSVAALIQIDKGDFELNDTVASHFPRFAANGKSNVTILQLVTHTSGFDADPSPSLANKTAYKTYEERIVAILDTSLINEPGSTYLYSDLNYMSLMLLLEHITGNSLDELIYNFTSRLGMSSTFFNRGNIEGPALPFYERMAAEEFQIAVLGPSEPARPQPVRGTVHDENAWALDGVSGHAGLFSTVGDTAKLCQMILNNGTYGGVRYLKEETVGLIFTNFNTRFPGDEHGVGFELNQYYTSGPMASLLAASHTGFTGTSMVIDRGSNTFFLHFSNRVHPSRTWSSNNIVREAVGYWVAKSLGKEIAQSPFP
ncbi:putative beta- protein [Phaeoacremonium minimum UCRPA7]|uniref:Putative beta-protein n=1 Tax=Phaeoacremonium minimum (strain UCR-PA7) TaxID=1286976 RepID=R8BFZ8_PHAM7|nr:putative beta- protein [Phaeoacremonium minimum UCRPA7]EON98241.1 putative beta- protein [Phaeoacremonium minimum UCRPA7]